MCHNEDMLVLTMFLNIKKEKFRTTAMDEMRIAGTEPLSAILS